MKQSFTTMAVALLLAVGVQQMQAYNLRVLMTDDSVMDIKIGEGYYEHTYKAREGSEALTLSLEKVTNSTPEEIEAGADSQKRSAVFEMPIDRISSISYSDGSGVGQIAPGTAVSISYDNGILHLVSEACSTQLSVAASDGTVLLRRSVTGRTEVPIKELGTGVRIVSFGENSFKILVTNN